MNVCKCGHDEATDHKNGICAGERRDYQSSEQAVSVDSWCDCNEVVPKQSEEHK